jgi:DNA invertase Pin-like site-specific DNA recombinase
MTTALKPAVGYIRMSSDRQEDSPARQRKDIESLATRSGYRVTTWYEDHGLTGTESRNRPEFQRLLANAKNGRFDVILLSEQSRMSREDIFDAMVHWKLLRDAGVKIITCQRGELDFSNLGGVITAIVDQYGAREESVKLAERVASGQRLKAMNGQRVGGIVFGYDREIYDDTGKLVRRVHFRERFRTPRSWRSKLVPSTDKPAVDAVKWAFKAVANGRTLCEVVREFNARGLQTNYGNAFTYSTVASMMSNPSYAGTLQAGRYSRGKFSKISETGMIVVENAHPAIVSPELFREVQEVLANRKAGRRHRHPTRYLLSELMVCQHCGIRMYGVRRTTHGGLIPFYQCNTSPAKLPYSSDCPHPAVRVERMETFLLQQIRERLLDPHAQDKIRDAILKATRSNAHRASRDQKRLAELRRKIERGTENLALASKTDFAAIAKLLNCWRDEEAELAERLDRRGRELEPLPEAIKVLARISDVPANLKLADREKLRRAIHETVTSISIGVRDTRVGKIQYREVHGELQFHEAFGIGPIAIPDEAIGQRRIWREIGELVRKAKRPLHLKDFCEHIGTADMSHAAYHVRRAEAAGLIRKVGHQGGWIAVPN